MERKRPTNLFNIKKIYVLWIFIPTSILNNSCWSKNKTNISFFSILTSLVLCYHREIEFGYVWYLNFVTFPCYNIYTMLNLFKLLTLSPPPQKKKKNTHKIHIYNTQPQPHVVSHSIQTYIFSRFTHVKFVF